MLEIPLCPKMHAVKIPSRIWLEAAFHNPLYHFILENYTRVFYRKNIKDMMKLQRIILLSLLVIGALLIVTIPDSFASHKPGHNPPGQGGDPPGQGGDPPGQGGDPPGQGGGPPQTPPGQGGEPPGQAKKSDDGKGGGYSGVPAQFLGIGFYKIIPINATNNIYSEFEIGRAHV